MYESPEMIRRKSNRLATLFVLVALLCCIRAPIVLAQDAPTAPQPVTPERFQQLEKAVQEIQRENRDLRDENKELRNRVEQFEHQQAGVQPATATNVPPTEKSNFVLPWGKESNLKLGGFLQANGEFGDSGSMFGVFPDSTVATPIHNRIFLRRARINVSGDFLENIDFKLEGDFEQGDGVGSSRTGFSGTDLFLNWHQFPEANIKVGQYKAPFGLEQLTPDTSIFTIERSQPTGALTPEREIGVQLWGKPLATLWPKQKDLIEYAFGVFNGNNRNTQLNDDGQFMYAGRVASTPFSGKLFGQDVKLKIGADAVYSRYGAGTRISQTGNLKFNADGSLGSFSVPAAAGSAAKSTSWGVDQSLTVGPFDLIAEYLEEKVEPLNSTAFTPFIANGYYVQGSYYFPGKKFQLVGKYESFNPGQAKNDDIESVIGGLNYYIKGDHLKLMLDYIHTWSDFRHANPSAGGDEFDEVLLRAQVMF